MHSSAPSILWLESEYQTPFALAPGKQSAIYLSAKSKSLEEKRVRVHCVETGAKELVHAWLVRLFTVQPPIAISYTVECILGKVNDEFAIRYKNRTESACVFIFESSDEQIIRVFI
jgi:hypothetical protein